MSQQCKFMFILGVALVVCNSSSAEEYKYDVNKLNSCFNQTKQRVLKTKPDAKDIRIGLGGKFGGSNLIYVTYDEKSGVSRMDLYDLPGNGRNNEVLTVATAELLNKEQHADEMKRRKYCYDGSANSVDWLIPNSSYAKDSKAGFSDQEDIHASAAIWTDKDSGKHMAHFNYLDFPAGIDLAFDGAKTGCKSLSTSPDVEMFSAKDSLSLKCDGGNQPCRIVKSSGNLSVSDAKPNPAIANGTGSKVDTVAPDSTATAKPKKVGTPQ